MVLYLVKPGSGSIIINRDIPTLSKVGNVIWNKLNRSMMYDGYPMEIFSAAAYFDTPNIAYINKYGQSRTLKHDNIWYCLSYSEVPVCLVMKKINARKGCVSEIDILSELEEILDNREKRYFVNYRILSAQYYISECYDSNLKTFIDKIPISGKIKILKFLAESIKILIKHGYYYTDVKIRQILCNLSYVSRPDYFKINTDTWIGLRLGDLELSKEINSYYTLTYKVPKNLCLNKHNNTPEVILVSAWGLFVTIHDMFIKDTPLKDKSYRSRMPASVMDKETEKLQLSLKESPSAEKILEATENLKELSKTGYLEALDILSDL